MSEPRRGRRALLGLFLLLVVGVLVPFALFGERFEAAFSLEGARDWMERYGEWAWAAGVALLIADLALPVPGTVVMSALGWIYGPWWGGLAGALGSMLSGLVAYALCRVAGRPLARRIAGEASLVQARDAFERRGGWYVASSRWLPVLPEAVACLAGLARMPWRRFVAALACGSIPLGFAFAMIGHLGHESPAGALALSALVPLALWAAAGRLFPR